MVRGNPKGQSPGAAKRAPGQGSLTASSHSPSRARNVPKPTSGMECPLFSSTRDPFPASPAIPPVDEARRVTVPLDCPQGVEDRRCSPRPLWLPRGPRSGGPPEERPANGLLPRSSRRPRAWALARPV